MLDRRAAVPGGVVDAEVAGVLLFAPENAVAVDGVTGEVKRDVVGADDDPASGAVGQVCA